LILMLYFLKLAVVGMVTVPAALVTILLGLFDPHGKHVYCISRFWAWLILFLGGVSVRVHGLDRLDARQCYLFMVNHQSNVDIPVLLHGLAEFQLRWIAKKELLWVPFLGWAMWAGKHISIDREDTGGALGSLKKAAARIAGGISIVVFPEGTRSIDGRLLPFKRGGFLLAAKTGTSIVPVTINGSHKILPKGAWRLRPGIVDVHVGEPLKMSKHRPGALRALAHQVQRIIEKRLAPDPGAAEPQAHGARQFGVGALAATVPGCLVSSRDGRTLRC
jgi:1-acyl-sn-glycerol-3-phosphate acyltransferase